MLTVVAALENRKASVWIAGVWGVDALLGEQTREHADVDLACRAEGEATIVDTLVSLGYRVVLDYRPGRLVLADDDGREVDLHPVRFNTTGGGVQTGLHGAEFHYPPDGFTTGSIESQLVPCLSAQQQLCFHAGYELRDHERQDVAKLRAAFGIT